jgi:peptidoglycan/LPS O-acetylase OafA/YrhL
VTTIDLRRRPPLVPRRPAAEPRASWRPALRYQPALDGVRGVAILAVVAFHTGLAPFGNGYYGVDVFFVLSGFLITGLVLQEHRTTGRVSLRLFYVRRAARLLPALVALCLALLAVAAVDAFVPLRPVLNPTSAHTAVVGVALALAYLGAWVEALTHTTLGALDHTWSLSVEEWFYAVWPPVLVLVLRRRGRVSGIVAAIAAGAVVERLVSEQVIGSPHYLYFAPDQHACQLLAGCALAVVLAEHGHRLRRHLRAVGAIGALGAAGVGLMLARPVHGRSLAASAAPYERGGMVLIALTTAAALAWLVLAPSSPLARALGWRPLVWVGRRSYGIYLYHVALIVLISPWEVSGRIPWRTGLISLSLTFVVAAASYRWLERPVMRWARRREERVRAAAETEPAQPLSSLVAAHEPA